MDAVHFWSIAALMVLATTGTLVVPLFWRGSDAQDAGVARAARLRRLWPAFALAALVPMAALCVYAAIGAPSLALTRATPAPAGNVADLHARAAALASAIGGGSGGDLGQAITRLRARLERDPRDAAGWRLLAKSYEYLGNAVDAADANRRAAAAESGATIQDSAPSMRSTATTPAPLPADAVKLAASAQEHRRKREFHAANQAFATLARRDYMNADLWADYADSVGGERGALNAEAAILIDEALRLDPDHPKALWLLGSWQTQSKDFTAALATWQRLAALLPADSPDSRLITANIAEARSRLDAAGRYNGTRSVPAALRGSVDLDPRWRGRISGGAVLYVLARAADEPGPPLAVLRVAAGTWPLRFVLDDSNAMMPDRKLSDFTRVILEARISASGNALAQPGDLRAVSAVLDPRAASDQRLTIGKMVGARAAQGG